MPVLSATDRPWSLISQISEELCLSPAGAVRTLGPLSHCLSLLEVRRTLKKGRDEALQASPSQ